MHDGASLRRITLCQAELHSPLRMQTRREPQRHTPQARSKRPLISPVTLRSGVTRYLATAGGGSGCTLRCQTCIQLSQPQLASTPSWKRLHSSPRTNSEWWLYCCRGRCLERSEGGGLIGSEGGGLIGDSGAQKAAGSSATLGKHQSAAAACLWHPSVGHPSGEDAPPGARALAALSNKRVRLRLRLRLRLSVSSARRCRPS